MTLACLPEIHYSTAFEPGCSIGVLTSDLAARSDVVLSMDLSALALASARETVPQNVQLRQGAVPADWPTESFELVLLSEVGYYLGARDCRRLGERVLSLARRTSSPFTGGIPWTTTRFPVTRYTGSSRSVAQQWE